MQQIIGSRYFKTFNELLGFIKKICQRLDNFKVFDFFKFLENHGYISKSSIWFFFYNHDYQFDTQLDTQ